MLMNGLTRTDSEKESQSAPDSIAKDRSEAKGFVASITIRSPATEVMEAVHEAEGCWTAGFTAAEGTFTSAALRRKFAFAVALGARDEESCLRLQRYFEVGSISRSHRRKVHHDDVVIYAVRGLADLINVIVPFMDEHLPPSYKREQYLAWREQLVEYWKNHAKRVRPCTVEGCDKDRRAHGLCRHHLFKAGRG